MDASHIISWSSCFKYRLNVKNQVVGTFYELKEVRSVISIVAARSDLCKMAR